MKIVFSILVMLFSVMGVRGQSISSIETTKNWYYIYDQDGKKIKTISTSQGELKGYSSTFYIIKQGSAFYVTYDVKGKRLHTWGASSVGEILGVAGDTFTSRQGAWIHTWSKEGKKISTRAAKTAQNPTPQSYTYVVALVGGGNNPQPGEISLAHNGVLFLDEMPELSRSVLEVLRQPLEDRKISIARAKYSVEYPCSFMLIASMNPCPCGYYGDPTHHCACTPGQIQRYMNKISGPLLDRIDIHCEIQAVPFAQLSQMQPGEPSATIRERVIAARNIQTERFSSLPKQGGQGRVHCNAMMSEKMLHEFAEPDSTSMDMLRMAMERLKLSARAYTRILKVARTIADLAGSERVESVHIAEAIGYRNLDRGDWAERGI